MCAENLFKGACDLLLCVVSFEKVNQRNGRRICDKL